jgi:hypothetical protein
MADILEGEDYVKGEIEPNWDKKYFTNKLDSILQWFSN